MDYDAMFQKARAVIDSRLRSGVQVHPDDTVCIISSQSDRLYMGTNRRDLINGRVMNVHAEAEAIRSMQAGGEAVINGLLLMSVSNGMPMLPCDHCLRCILTLHPENEKCELLLHDCAMPISQLSQFEELRGISPKPVHGAEGAVSDAPKASSADYLRDRVNSLLHAADDVEPPKQEEDSDTFSVKKLFGGLFGKNKSGDK